MAWIASSLGRDTIVVESRASRPMTSNASGPDAVSLNAGYVVRRLVVGIAAGTRCPRQARPRQGRVSRR
jgi:hypothetical protein